MTGRVAQRGYLGIVANTVAIPEEIAEQAGLEQETGVMIFSVEAGSPARKAGLPLHLPAAAVDLRRPLALLIALRRANADADQAWDILPGDAAVPLFPPATSRTAPPHRASQNPCGRHGN